MPCGESVAGLDGDLRSATAEFPGAAGIVHDLGNLIQIAASAVNIIGRSPRAGRDAALEPILARAQSALERAGALVRQSRRRTAEPSFEVRARPDLQSIPSCLEEIQALLAWICEPGVTLSIEFGPDLPPVRCNRIELQNAVLNLVINARDATPDGGSIDVVVRCLADGPFASALELSVVDDGAGMSSETLALAFTPYFTTKADGCGTGLGLAIVQRFAHRAGGRVDIVSAPGEGTTVTLRLPSATEACS